jgi:hypothetical protein
MRAMTLIMTAMLVARASFLALVLSSLPGCGSSNALCSLEARSGVNVTLKDAVTKKPVCDAKVIITDGGEVRDEPTPLGPDCLYSGAVERTGTFKVEITHPTYAPVTREGIEVKMDEAGCHVEGQRVEVEMKAP